MPEAVLELKDLAARLGIGVPGGLDAHPLHASIELTHRCNLLIIGQNIIVVAEQSIGTSQSTSQNGRSLSAGQLGSGFKIRSVSGSGHDTQTVHGFHGLGIPLTGGNIFKGSVAIIKITHDPTFV